MEATRRAQRLEGSPDRAIGGDPAGNHQGGASGVWMFGDEPVETARNTIGERIGDGSLEGCTEIRNVLFGERSDRGGGLTDRSLQSGEGEIRPGLSPEGTGQRESGRIALPCGLFDRRSARIG